jgi:FtsZ-interacting cell division protein ZipA
MREAAPQALTLALEVARAPDTRRTFDSMTRFANQLASLLGGRMVDDNGNVLDERAVAAIAQQLEAVRAKLEARGIAPGSAAALRVFA